MAGPGRSLTALDATEQRPRRTFSASRALVAGVAPSQGGARPACGVSVAVHVEVVSCAVVPWPSPLTRTVQVGADGFRHGEEGDLTPPGRGRAMGSFLLIHRCGDEAGRLVPVAAHRRPHSLSEPSRTPKTTVLTRTGGLIVLEYSDQSSGSTSRGRCFRGRVRIWSGSSDAALVDPCLLGPFFAFRNSPRNSDFLASVALKNLFGESGSFELSAPFFPARKTIFCRAWWLWCTFSASLSPGWAC